MAKIFISYRRSDTGAEAQLLHDKIAGVFGEKQVFMDVHDIHIGSNWIEELKRSGSEAGILLVLIGDRWMEKKDGIKRLDNPEDWVRKEIEMAIERKMTIIPVLYNNQYMPQKQELPESLHKLTEQQAFEIRHEKTELDMEDLITKICPKVSSGFKCYLRSNKMVFLTLSVIIFLSIIGSLFYWFSLRDHCKEYRTNADIKNMIVVNKQDGENLIKRVKSEFERLNDDRIDAQSLQYIGGRASDDRYESEALKCNPDFMMIATYDEREEIRIEFSIINDSLKSYQADQDFNLFLSESSIPFEERYVAKLELAVCLMSGFVMTQQGRYGMALQQLNRCNYEGAPIEVRSLVTDMQITSKIAIKDIIGAHQTAVLAMKSGIDHSEMILKRGILAEELGYHPDAIMSYSALIERGYGDRIKTLEKRADLYLFTNNPGKAKADYDRILTIDPNRVDIRNKSLELGKILEIKGQDFSPAFNPGNTFIEDYQKGEKTDDPETIVIDKEPQTAIFHSVELEKPEFEELAYFLLENGINIRKKLFNEPRPFNHGANYLVIYKSPEDKDQAEFIAKILEEQLNREFGVIKAKRINFKLKANQYIFLQAK